MERENIPVFCLAIGLYINIFEICDDSTLEFGFLGIHQHDSGWV